MITLNLDRHRDGQLTSQSSREETPAQALTFLVQSELAYNARVIELTPDRIHLETLVADMIDVTYLSGSADEMRNLVDVVACYQLTTNCDGIVNGGAAHDFCRATAHSAAYSGIIMNLGAPMFVGRSRLRVAVMLALGYRDESDLTAAAAITLADLMAVFELMAENQGTNFRDMIALLGLNPAN